MSEEMENSDSANLEENLARMSDEMMDLLHTVEQSPKVATTAQIDQKQEEMDAHDENNSKKKRHSFSLLQQNLLSKQ